MKKILLSIISVVALVGASYSQGLTINLVGSSTDISGTAVNYEIAGAVTDEHLVDFIVNNETGSDQPWIITRRHVNNPTGWEEYLCWGLNGAIGNCYLHDPNAMWSSGSENILADSSGVISTYVTCSTAGTATYRYYVSTDGQTFIDSVDLIINNVLSVEEKPSLSVNVAPNPANDYISIKATGANNASVTIVDVLGNVVLKETIVGANGKNLNVAKFRNGIYFVMVEAEGAKAVTRKVIVRH